MGCHERRRNDAGIIDSALKADDRSGAALAIELRFPLPPIPGSDRLMGVQEIHRRIADDVDAFPENRLPELLVRIEQIDQSPSRFSLSA